MNAINRHAPKYEKTGAVMSEYLGLNSLLNGTTSNTQLKLRTYTDPGSFFTLRYPANWTAIDFYLE